MGDSGIWGTLDRLFAEWIVPPLSAVIFFDVAFWDDASGDAIQVPLVVLWLIIGAIYFTVSLGFVNLRGLRHAIDCVRSYNFV